MSKSRELMHLVAVTNAQETIDVPFKQGYDASLDCLTCRWSTSKVSLQQGENRGQANGLPYQVIIDGQSLGRRVNQIEVFENAFVDLIEVFVNEKPCICICQFLKLAQRAFVNSFTILLLC